jgi:beta-lactam-binding protein with PASTA domain
MVTTMFSCRTCFVLMIVLSWTSSFQAQQPQTKAMALARPRPVPVPDFTGKTLDQVRSQAVLPGSGQQLFASIRSEGPANGVVATQVPGAGTPIVPGSSRLFLTMAAPKPTPLQAFLHQLAAPQAKTTRVPKLLGATRDRASRDLEVAHLKANFTGDAGGIVVQQYPQDNMEVPWGSLVTVTLAIPEVIVPSLYGLTLEQASDRLKENSLQTGKIEGENTPGSTVTSQYPPAGAQEPPGTEVAVTMMPVPQPPEQQSSQEVPLPIYVPNLEKMSLSDADAALTKVGLRTGDVKGSKAGFVSDQQPKAGTAVEAGIAVDFTLSLPTVVVPDVRDDSEAAATTSLENFGLQPKIFRAKNWDENARHAVVSQDPSAGSTVDVGSQVTVILGNFAPPPPVWKSVPGRVAAALPLAPWWFWLATGLPLGAIGAAVIKTMWPSPRPREGQILPPAQCTLEPVSATPKIRFGSHGGPKLQFTVALRDRDRVAQYHMGREPAVTRKEVNRDGGRPGRND